MYKSKVIFLLQEKLFPLRNCLPESKFDSYRDRNTISKEVFNRNARSKKS